MSGAAVVLAAGLCCSLGSTRAEAAAAYRQGDRLFQRDEKLVGPDGLPLRTAPVFPLPSLQNLELRLQRLFDAACADLASQGGDTFAPVPMQLVVPTWLVGTPLAERLRDKLAHDWARVASDIEFISSAEASIIGMVGDATSATAAVRLVGALDTFINAELLDALAMNDRLLTRSQPHGVVPSEAAVIFRVGRRDKEGMTLPIGRVITVAETREENDVRRPQGILGRALADAFVTALDGARIDRLMIDLNGERWRSEEISFVFSAVDTIPDGMDADFETPPLNTGFCGIATGGVLLALALTASEHSDDTPLGAVTLISSSQFDGLRVVATVERSAPATTAAEMPT